jgi:hypothetical protein
MENLKELYLEFLMVLQLVYYLVMKMMVVQLVDYLVMN